MIVLLVLIEKKRFMDFVSDVSGRIKAERENRKEAGAARGAAPAGYYGLSVRVT